MGLFDRILKDIKREVVDKVIDKVVDELAPSSNTVTNNAPISTNSAPAQNTFRYTNDHNTGDEYFASLIQESEFDGYTIERNVHPNVFDSSAHPKCFPISYLFKQNGVPKLAVFIMKTNQYKAMIAQGSYEVLNNNGIHYIRFFKGMENERSYVLNRIRENLN